MCLNSLSLNKFCSWILCAPTKTEMLKCSALILFIKVFYCHKTSYMCVKWQCICFYLLLYVVYSLFHLFKNGNVKKNITHEDEKHLYCEFCLITIELLMLVSHHLNQTVIWLSLWYFFFSICVFVSVEYVHSHYICAFGI